MPSFSHTFPTSLILIGTFVLTLSPSCAISAEVEKNALPVYGTCTPAKSGGEFQAAICLLKQLCPTCDFGTLNKNNIKVVVRNKEVDTLYVTTERIQNYGLISTKGTVEVRVINGNANELCLQNGRDTKFESHSISYKGCIVVNQDGKPREFVYPPRFKELFNNVKFTIKYVNSDPRDRDKLTIESLVLSDKASICGETFPKGTEILNHLVSEQIPFGAKLPIGATLSDGRRPKENEQILLTDENYNCNIHITEKFDD